MPRAAGCRRGWARSRSCCASRSGGHGEVLAADAGMTLAAGGKRLRPLLVLLCAGADGGEGVVRAAAAIELVHMATLVHDDVLDAAPLRRGPADGRRDLRPRPCHGDRRPALLARLRLARRRTATGARSSCWPRPRWRSPAASWPSATMPSTPRSAEAALPRALPAEDGEAVRMRLPAGPRRGGAGRLRRRDRARLPAARRRARRRRPARAHRQGARHRPARRHRHPAADPAADGGPGDPLPPICAPLTRAARRGALRPHRRHRRPGPGPRPRPWQMVAAAKARLDSAGLRPRAAQAPRPGRRRRRPALRLSRLPSGSRRP